MAINQLKIYSNFNAISFKQKQSVQTAPNVTTQNVSQDIFVKETNIEPPEIKPSQFLYNGNVDLTDEQIIQINKAKRLPANARFIYNNGRGQVPHYDIIKANPNESLPKPAKKHFLPAYASPRIDLPEGYEVERNYQGYAKAFPIEQKTKN